MNAENPIQIKLSYLGEAHTLKCQKDDLLLSLNVFSDKYCVPFVSRWAAVRNRKHRSFRLKAKRMKMGIHRAIQR